MNFSSIGLWTAHQCIEPDWFDTFRDRYRESTRFVNQQLYLAALENKLTVAYYWLGHPLKAVGRFLLSIAIYPLRRPQYSIPIAVGLWVYRRAPDISQPSGRGGQSPRYLGRFGTTRIPAHPDASGDNQSNTCQILELPNAE